MSSLNEPVGYEPRPEDDWTPAIGLRRGLIAGLITAGLMALLMVPLTCVAPLMVLVIWLRAPLAFALMWILFRVIVNAAGMIDRRIIALTLGLTILVLISNHVPLIRQGVPALEGEGDWWAFPLSVIDNLFPRHYGVLRGLRWLHPYVLLAVNAVPVALGGTFFILLVRRN
ncbi:MAG: hypothetical protein KAY37_12930 [Phycisphaerae bacterium]|nr:hypothetical protein [Phycisphaerae bacterium]